jgi:precorrin-4/cobalt-precorrin-4 C11-methyltransferase
VTVHFIGAGPGDADLITVRGRDLIAASPVCLYAGSLVPEALLSHAPPGARLVDTQGLSLDEIIAAMAEAHGRGEDVARLHSGDLSVFSAMAEQTRRLDALGIPWDATPGVPAFAAAAAALGRELTLPGVAQTVILARPGGRATPVPDAEALGRLAVHRTTLVLHLAAGAAERIAGELLPAYGPACPVAVIAHATQPAQVIVRTALGELEAAVEAAGIRRNAIVIVGPALAAEGFRDSHLYSAGRARDPAGG